MPDRETPEQIAASIIDKYTSPRVPEFNLRESIAAAIKSERDRAEAWEAEARAWRAWNEAEQLVGTESEVDVNANTAWAFVEDARARTDAGGFLA